jgi:hypothetical protein
MTCGCVVGSKLGGVVAGVLAAAAVGTGGYNWYTTGCPLGTCRESCSTEMVNVGDQAASGASCDEKGVCPTEVGDSKNPLEVPAIEKDAIAEKPAIEVVPPAGG